ncbi:MAG TPA: PDZ domain-containing protein, partial [Edaphobacter sp.]|nr:PDZ domain-containing protein [Edaphobacter sp.]
EFSFPAGLTLSTDDANTLSFAGLWPLIGRPFYGNIGYDVLKDLVVQFDYERKIVTFSSPAAARRSGDGQVFNTTLEMNYDPQFAGAFTVSGLAPVPTRFTVDTGAGGTIINAPLTKANHLMENVRDKLPSPSHGIGEGESNDLVARIAGISLGRYELQRPLVALSQDTEGSLAMASIGVNLGGNLLRRFTVTIDYPGRTLTLEPNSHFADPFPADASGLILKAEGDDFKTFIVSALVPDSPATAAGLQQGDVITAIDGRPADKYVLWELQELFKNSGHIVTLGVRRGSRSFTCRISLRSLV